MTHRYALLTRPELVAATNHTNTNAVISLAIALLAGIFCRKVQLDFSCTKAPVSRVPQEKLGVVGWGAKQVALAHSNTT